MVATEKCSSEFALIHWIKEQAGEDNRLICGIGDDCSIDQLAPDQQLLTSTDLLIEDIHFKREWTSMFDLGRKSVAVNVSDIAAMGGVPRALYLGVGRPKQVSERELKEFMQGFIGEVQRYDAVLAGGDTSTSPGPLIIAVTVHGHIKKGTAVERCRAQVGDAIYVSGTLGDSALALQSLTSGRIPPPELLQRLHTPEARVAIGRSLSQEGLASAMLDVSDGLLADLGHILSASGVGAEINIPALPLSAAFRHELEKNEAQIDLALAGGDDYELLFTSPRHDLDQCSPYKGRVVKIGVITPGSGTVVRQEDGGIYHCGRRGYDHFAEE